ncbi:MAG: hypothetical protein IJ124_06240 [Clostridia bacterium]|nr:hypothetical protein [Clostridia bacterium]
MIVKVTALCVAAAMICSALRIQRPEMATALSLAAGLAVLAMIGARLSEARRWAEAFERLAGSAGGLSSVILKGAGIAVISQLGAQLCVDAGESALAGRITLAARIAMLGLCAPLLAELTGLLERGAA